MLASIVRAATAAAAFTFASIACAAQYATVDMAPFFLDGANVRAVALTPAGQLVAAVNIIHDDMLPRPGVFTPAAGVRHLDDPDTVGDAIQVNASAQVLGWMAGVPVVYGPRSRKREIVDPKASSIMAWGLSADGKAVTGVAYLASGAHAFVHTARTGLLDLGTFGGSDSVGTAVNSGGQVTGNADTENGSTHAFHFVPGQGLRDIAPAGADYSSGSVINERGDIAGVARVGGTYRTFVKTAQGPATLLDTFAGQGSPLAINSFGHVTGDSFGSDGVRRAFLYTPARGVVDLQALIDDPVRWELLYGWAINDRGQILVVAADKQDGWTFRFLRLDPIR